MTVISIKVLPSLKINELETKLDEKKSKKPELSKLLKQVYCVYDIESPCIDLTVWRLHMSIKRILIKKEGFFY